MGDFQIRGPDSTVVAAVEAEFERELARTGSDDEADDRCANGLADGEIVYGAMQPASLYGQPGLRASGAHACIVETRPSKKRKPATPFGYESDMGMDRGHLVAYTFGGSNLAANIVPLYSRVNQTDMRDSVEAATAAAVRSGQKVAYDVTPIYVGGSPIPVAIQVHAVGTGGFKCNIIIANYRDEDGQRSSC